MNEINKALAALKQTDAGVTSQIIVDLIKDHAAEAKAARTLYSEYTGDVKILKRGTTEDEHLNGSTDTADDDICNKIVNDFRGYIIDTMSGYFLGNPIAYGIDGIKEGPGIDKIKEFNTRNNAGNLDKLSGKRSGTCGSAGRLYYIDPDGHERMKNLDPWEIIFVNDGSIDGTQYALRYYDVQVKSGADWDTRKRVEWYDVDTVYFYMEDQSGNYGLDPDEPPILHMFSDVPCIEFPNNEERQGDFVKVSTLIDAYDRDISYDQDEHEAFRNTYLILTNTTLGDETNSKEVKNSRTMELGEGATAQYLTKDVNDTYVENHKKRLESNIHQFSRIPDMTDENFSGTAQSGESRKWKLVGMETKAGDKELMMTQALRQQYKLLTGVWAQKGLVIDYLKITFEFTRNLPVELAGAAETTKNLKGLVSDKTRLGLLPFIDDPEAEMKQMDEEAPEVDLDAFPPENDAPDGSEA